MRLTQTSMFHVYDCCCTFYFTIPEHQVFPRVCFGGPVQVLASSSSQQVCHGGADADQPVPAPSWLGLCHLAIGWSRFCQGGQQTRLLRETLSPVPPHGFP